MRRVKFLVAIIALILLGVTIYLFIPRNFLSSDQQNLVKILGYPDQFVITYLPRADGSQLVRSETWYYPKTEKQYSFLAGKLAFVDATPASDLPKTQLKPEDFDFSTNFSDIQDIFGQENLNPVDYLDVFSTDGVQTYFSDQAVIILESDHLTYFQTL